MKAHSGAKTPLHTQTGLQCRCGRAYAAGPDLVVPDDVWAKISPTGDEGGILCPNCIHDALVGAGFADGSVQAAFTSGPMADPAWRKSPDGLLPCPFCGGKARDCHNGDVPFGMYWVPCDRCHACPGDKNSREEAIDAWNTRAPRPPCCGGRGMSARVYVEVSGLTGSGKSAIMGEIEIALRSLGLAVEHDADFQAEKNATHADWQTALDLYKPTVVLRERNIPRPKAALSRATGGEK